ncbi:MAG TPA: cbb3-type cytochrome c oxidase N-terminal domain-containing protein [Tepidisphaeraceae bacterium]|nr:cbb3-type cytochrome c oxidase N-terminal domain-containing protein [Tepidisphaeraceae bacterium]
MQSAKENLGPKLTGHNYEGIEEYDNPMPGWWSWLFAATIGFSALYLLFAALAGSQFGPLGAYEQELSADADRQFAAVGEVKSDPESLLALSKAERAMTVGKALFQTHCTACHGPAGAGLTGPNLTDESYINVRTVGDVPDVVRKGRNNGAMPAWENRLTPRDVAVLSAYVLSLRGTNVPGRPPEGQSIAAWSAK